MLLTPLCFSADDSIDFAFFKDIKQFVKRACNFHRRRREKKLSHKKQAAEKAWWRAEFLRLDSMTKQSTVARCI